MPDGQVVFEITGDNREVRRSLQDTTRVIEQESRNWDSAASTAAGRMENCMGGAFKKISIAAAASTVGKVLLDWGKSAVAAASDLQEVQNVVDVTFGTSAVQIDAWAKKAQTQFGLTETQAKKFTSTLGAMMKSAGMAGPEIVSMSTDLAGLAADMASFYNLDFETAFQKIRSGISGETEPLKQLGINMSTANLEAFALTQGITKAFDKMSQGEQTLLRYQYLMSATADAQGDFARTSDGFANSQRRLETALETINTALGTTLLDYITPVVAGLADIVTGLTTPAETTVLDNFNGIDLDTAEKIAAIKKTAEEANALVGVLNDIAASTVKTEENTRLEGFISTLSKDIGGLNLALLAAQMGNVPGALEELGEALKAELGGDPDKWRNLLQAISQNLPGVTSATGKDTTTADFLSAAAAAADDLGGDYSQYWGNLLSALGDHAGDAIAALAGGQETGAILSGIAAGSNELGALSGVKWSAFIGAVNGLESDTPKNLAGVADALSKNLGGDAGKWETLLQAIGNNLGAVTTAVGADGTKTADWLAAAASAADDLGDDYSAYWANLLKALGDNAAAAISALSGGMNSGMVVRNIALGANLLGDNAPGNWSKLFSALQRVNGLQNIFSDSGAAGNVESLAKALSENSPDTTRAEAWQTFLGALQQNAGALTALTKTSADETAAWLSSLASAANTLSPENANGWSLLFGSFVSGLPGLQDTEEGQQFFQSIAQEFLAMGTESEEAKAGLLALGMSTDEIDQAQRQWLETCKRLVKTIPGLSSVVNTQTGAVAGGTSAIQKYLQQWEELQKINTFLDAAFAKREALNEKIASMEIYEVDYLQAQKRYENAQKAYNMALQNALSYYREDFSNATEHDLLRYLDSNSLNSFQNDPILYDFKQLYEDLKKSQTELEKTKETYNSQKEALESARKDAAALDETIVDLTNDQQSLSESAQDVARELTLIERVAAGDEAAISSITTATQKAVDALTALEEYQAKVREETAQNIAQVVKGFENIVTPAQRARNEMADLTKQIEQLNAAGEDTKSLETTKKGMEDSIPSVQKMTAALESQLQFMREYQAEMQLARDNGVDQGILAMLSDGSQESFDYLYALNHTGGNIEALNKMYQEVQAERETMADKLTESQLRVDAEYKSLKSEALLTVEGLKELKDPAYENTVDVMAAIVQALQESQPGLTAQVDAINAILSRITGPGFIFTTPLYQSFYGVKPGRHANGLDNVPYDGYLAYLHQGERVQTAAEAELSRRYALQQPGMDYGAMGSAIGANMPGMGNMQIVWRGRVVADVLSEMQGDSYRALERSGWKS
jgi:hypothetical protein